MRFKKILIIIIAVLVLVAVATGVSGAYENERLVVTDYVIINEKIPESFSDYKIVQVSDFHNPKSTKLVDKVVKAVEDCSPDIIVITGDLIDSRDTQINIALDFVTRISEFAPVYFITGNHEGRINDYQRLKNGLENIGVTILENECEVLHKDGEEINLVGLKDLAFNDVPDIGGKRLLSGWIADIDYDRDNYTVLLAHHPEYPLAYSEQNIDLALTGHAHGGQIRLPLIGGLYAPGQGLFPKYEGGVYELSDMTTMIVNRGIGNSIYPFRINNPPEVVAITLEK